jgi:hypothetical protein
MSRNMPNKLTAGTPAEWRAALKRHNASGRFLLEMLDGFTGGREVMLYMLRDELNELRDDVSAQLLSAAHEQLDCAALQLDYERKRDDSSW